MCCSGTSRSPCSPRWRRSIRGSSGSKADAFAPVPPGIRPEWYFLAMFHTLKLLPSHMLGIEGEVVGVVGIRPRRGRPAARAVSRSARSRETSRARLFTALGIGGLVYFVAFTIIGHLAS